MELKQDDDGFYGFGALPLRGLGVHRGLGFGFEVASAVVVVD